LTRRIAIFYPTCPAPAQGGSHRRCLEMLEGFNALGLNVSLLSTTLGGAERWQKALRDDLLSKFTDDVHVYDLGIAERKAAALIHRGRALLGRVPPMDSRAYSFWGVRRWFSRTCESLAPDALLMNYANWDRILDHRRFSGLKRIMETHDLLTLNLKMHGEVDRRLPPEPIRPGSVPDVLVQEDFFSSLGLEPDPLEFSIYDRYDATIAISRREQAILEASTHRTKVVFLPMTAEPALKENDFSGPALYTMGKHPYTLQGYLYFLRRVVPLLRENGKDFRLDVTGAFYRQVEPVPESGMVFKGFVPDLEAVYRRARFAVCPVLGGTGQQVKIVEAMAQGLPVVALDGDADPFPVVHGENGFAVRGAEEMAECILALWRDRARCRTMGDAARETVRETLSRSRLLNDLEGLLAAPAASLKAARKADAENS
jgi:glycosyltransferase involved in cell wall biosynthesis